MKIEDIDKLIGMPDVEQEWAKFSHEVIDDEAASTATIRPQRAGSWRRAAVIALICSLGFVALASVVYVGFMRSGEAPHEAVVSEHGAEPAPTAEVAEEVDDAFVFDNVTLQEIIFELATHYGVVPSVENSEAAQMRLYVTLDMSMTLEEVVEYLNNLQGVNLRLEGERLVVK